MFSSTYDSNSFLTFPSSSYPNTLPCYIDPENNDFANNNNTFLHDPLVVPFIPSTTNHDAPIFSEETLANLAVADCTAMLERDANNGHGSVGVHYGSIPNFLTQKPAIVKKDRHSKIHTSQGLRDRRVRLSSEIARKFFDLQDMLEFDKPSNTLEWLFTKSENAIKELARSKNSSSCSGGDKCSCDQPHGVDTSNEKSSGGSGGDASKGRKLKWAQREDVCVQTKKESREKARARARERTCYKMCSNTTGRVQDLEERCPATSNTTQILHQLMRPLSTQAEHEACARWPHQMVQQPYPNYPQQVLASDQSPRDGFNVIEESIMIKRNMKPSMMSSSHSQNLVIPKEASFNNNEYHSLPYTSTPNWDTNGAFNNGNSNFCGIATMNLSTFFMNQCDLLLVQEENKDQK